MKSKIQTIPPNDVFVSDVEWEKVVFDKEELLKALAENDIAGLARDVLRPKYGHQLVFNLLVAEVAHAILDRIADNLRQTVTYDACTALVSSTLVERAERKARERMDIAKRQAYWRGEP